MDVTCPDCNGTAELFDFSFGCPRCKATGRVPIEDLDRDELDEVEVTYVAPDGTRRTAGPSPSAVLTLTTDEAQTLIKWAEEGLLVSPSSPTKQTADELIERLRGQMEGARTPEREPRDPTNPSH